MKTSILEVDGLLSVLSARARSRAASLRRGHKAATPTTSPTGFSSSRSIGQASR